MDIFAIFSVIILELYQKKAEIRILKLVFFGFFEAKRMIFQPARYSISLGKGPEIINEMRFIKCGNGGAFFQH